MTATGSLFSFTVSKRPSAAKSDSIARKNVGEETLSIADLKELGRKAFSAQDYGQAHEVYTRAIAIAIARRSGTTAKADDGVHVLYANRSAVYMAICQYEDALSDAEQAVALSPQPWPKAFYRRATAQAALHRNVPACVSWEKVVEIEEAAAAGGVPGPLAVDGTKGETEAKEKQESTRKADHGVVEGGEGQGGDGCQVTADGEQQGQEGKDPGKENGTSSAIHADRGSTSVSVPAGAAQGGDGERQSRVPASWPRPRSPELKQACCRLADLLLLIFRGLACPRALKPGEDPALNELRADLDEGGYDRLLACASSQQHVVASAAGVQLAILASSFEYRMKFLQPGQGLHALLGLAQEPLVDAYEGPHAGLENVCRVRLGTGYHRGTPLLATVVGIANLTLGAPPVFCRELGNRPGVMEGLTVAVALAEGDMKIRDVAAKCFESMTAMPDPTLAQRAWDSRSVPALLDLLAMDSLVPASAREPAATGGAAAAAAPASAAGAGAAGLTGIDVASASLKETQVMTCRGSALAALASLCRHPPVEAAVLDDEHVSRRLLDFVLRCFGSYNCDAVLSPCFALLNLMAKKCSGDGPDAFAKQLLGTAPELTESLRKLTVIKRGGGSAEAARSGGGVVGAGVRAESRSLLRKLEAAASKA